MPCPLCGDICRCSSGENPAANPGASPRWLADAGSSSPAITPRAEPEMQKVEAPEPPPAPEASTPVAGDGPAPDDPPAWRQEIAARLNRYQTRRKPRPPRYPSLLLRFDENPTSGAGGISNEASFSQRTTTASNHALSNHALSNQALALDSFADTAI